MNRSQAREQAFKLLYQIEIQKEILQISINKNLSLELLKAIHRVIGLTILCLKKLLISH